ncbi:GntR family transcriptional regulator [Paenibacillus sp. KS-LC4]|uniref:GntR family transcriptional regulator n=1 Tax=Paenibacillus sp. KS-LC4 TaxID=2979727 RepID=UPI0030CED90B
MIIHIDMQSEVPIYIQLVNQVIEGIAKGMLQPGESLPSVRRMASDIGINMHTVNKAYHLLKQGDFIEMHQRKGVIIQSMPPTSLISQYRPLLIESLRPVVASAICKGISEEQLQSLVNELYRNIKEFKGENHI